MLVFIPWPTNTGYAMHRAETQFLAVARKLSVDPSKIFFAYQSLSGGRPRSLPEHFDNVVACDLGAGRTGDLAAVEKLIRKNGIDVVLGYDLGVSSPCYARLRRAGISTIISYWGAPMSQANSGMVLLIKKLQVLCSRHRPDHFVFQSLAMQRLAVDGRGVPAGETSMLPTGIDIDALPDRAARQGYAHSVLGVPPDRKMVVFSGHIHPRKGIAVLIGAMRELVQVRRRTDVHAVLLGAIDTASVPLVKLVRDLGLEDTVTFAGYRHDVFDIFSSASVGVLPTTGWDSFPRSGLEMQGCGLPLIVSRLHGLPEMIEEGSTGFTVTPGDPVDLANRIEQLTMDEDLRQDMGRSAASRVRERFTNDCFIDKLAALIGDVSSRSRSARTFRFASHR